MQTCPKCQSFDLNKHGYYRKAARLICCACGHTFTPGVTRINPQLKIKVPQLHEKGCTLKNIAKELGISESTVKRYLKEFRDREKKSIKIAI